MFSGAGATAYAVEIPDLLDVPVALSEPVRSQFLDQHQGLANRLTNLENSISVFNSDCASVDKGSVAASNCRDRQGSLQSLLRTYIMDVTAFNRRIAFQKGMTLLVGSAFKMGSRMRAYAHQSLKSLKDISRILIGVWYAERGSYQRARHLASLPNITAEELKEMDSVLLSLERKKRKLLKKSIPRLVISGDVNSRLFSRYPVKFGISLLKAHLNIKSGNYDIALRQIATARNMHIKSPALAEAEVYVRQMKASAMEKKSPTNPALITHQANMASAYAGWSLGMALMDADMDATAVQVLSTSAQTLAREENIEDSKTIFRLAHKIQESHGESKDWLPSPGIYDTASEADILLDSLEYGNHDWNRSLMFLKLAHKASPGNERIKEAIAHAQALMASER